jgi:type IV pilus assembly protein PilP
MSKFFACLLAVSLLGLLQGCGESDHDDLRAWMAESSKNLRGKIPPLPDVKPYEPVSYEAASLIDPFRVAKLEPEHKKGGGGLRPDFNRPKEPLESFPLESLKYVGFLQRGKMPNALILADGAVHQVKIGNYIGQDFGIITSLTETELSVRELVQDSSGDWIERVSALHLQEQGAGK